MENYWSRVSELGTDASPYRATFVQIMCVAEKPDAVAAALVPLN